MFIEQGASDQWEKIDNSSVLDGIGTGGSVAGWAGSGTSNTLTNSPITFSGNNITIPGDTTITNGQLTVTHDTNNAAKIIQTATSMSNSTYTFEVDSSSHNSNMSTAGAMAVDVNSGRAFTITGAGNVGVGTDNPASRLQIASTGANPYSATLDSSSNMKGIRNVLTSNTDDMVGVYFATGTTTNGTHWSGITGQGVITHLTGEHNLIFILIIMM